MRWLILLSLLLLSACANTQFGVPEEVWGKMSEAERLEAIRGYNERTRLQAEAAQRAAEARRMAEREAAVAREARIRDIHAGLGRPGDLIRVSLQGGSMRLGGKPHGYAPVAFSLASGEILQIEVQSSDQQRSNYLARLLVAYEDGLLLIDGAPDSRHAARAGRLTYDPGWRQGMRYLLNSGGPMELQNVEVMVSTVQLPGAHR